MFTQKDTKTDMMMALMKPKPLANERELEPWIETFTGKQFSFLDPPPEQIDIRDIAHSLAYTCRFTGHSKRFYSVAEHSIFVSYLANDPLAGLLHDASEAYVADISSPVKPHLTNYKQIEDTIMRVIAYKFGFDYPLSADIKDCDATQLKTEAKHLLKSGGVPWAHKYPTSRAHGIAPQCMGPEAAEIAFLQRFEEVRNVQLSGANWPYDKIDDGSRGITSGGGLYCKADIQPNKGPLRSNSSSGEGNHQREDSKDKRTGFSYADPRFGFSKKAT